MICAKGHKVENHRYGVTGYIIKIGKIYTHIMRKYGNCKIKQ